MTFNQRAANGFLERIERITYTLNPFPNLDKAQNLTAAHPIWNGFLSPNPLNPFPESVGSAHDNTTGIRAANGFLERIERITHTHNPFLNLNKTQNLTAAQPIWNGFLSPNPLNPFPESVGSAHANTRLPTDFWSGLNGLRTRTIRSPTLTKHKTLP